MAQARDGAGQKGCSRWRASRAQWEKDGLERLTFMARTVLEKMVVARRPACCLEMTTTFFSLSCSLPFRALSCFRSKERTKATPHRCTDQSL